MREAQAVVEGASADIDNAMRSAAQNVGISWANLVVARASIRAGRLEVSAARLAFEGVQEEAKVGARTTLDVLDAEQEVLDARQKLVVAQRDEYVSAYSLRAFLSTQAFAVNILRAGQEEISDRFARALKDKWSGIDYELWDSGCPILTAALASFECKIRHTYHGGDHVIFVGEVLRLRHDPEGQPLLFHGGKYRGVTGDG